MNKSAFCVRFLLKRMLCLAFLLSPFSFLIQVSAQRYQADFHVSRANFSDTISIDWEREQVYVPVYVDGRRYRFLLDTGAGQSVVFDGTPLAEGYRVGTIISHDAMNRTDTASVVMLPPLVLGNTVLSGCRATVTHTSTLAPRPATAHRYDGILGFDLVNGGLSLKIDVPHRQLIVTDQPDLFLSDTQAPGAVIMKYRLFFHSPYIDITPFGNRRLRVLFDTGSRQFFSMNKQNFDVADARAERRRSSEAPDYVVEGRSWGRHAIGHSGVEAEGEVVFLRLDNLRLGSYSFTDLHTITTQGGSHLGAPLLAYGAVVLDGKHRRFIFLPDGYEQPCRVSNRQLEIAFVSDAQGRPQAGIVWEGGVPWKQGFRSGDVIEAIDGRPVRSFAQFATWGFERGRAYTFTLRGSDGRLRDVSWVRLP